MYRIYETRTNPNIGIQVFFKNCSSNKEESIIISHNIFKQIININSSFMRPLIMLVICRNKFGIYNIDDQFDSKIIECFKDIQINDSFLESLEKSSIHEINNIINFK